MINSWVERVGLLRLLFLGLVVALVVGAPFAGGDVHYDGWKIVPTVVVPALVPVVFFVIPLDMTMCAVYMSSHPDQRTRYRFIIWLDLTVLVVLLLAWLPFFYRLVTLAR